MVETDPQTFVVSLVSHSQGPEVALPGGGAVRLAGGPGGGWMGKAGWRPSSF